MSHAPIILWLRRDLRLDDHPALSAAAASGRPVVPVFILDPETETMGAAPLWRLGLAVESFGTTLGALGARLVLRRGKALEVLRTLVAETGARDVWWSRYCAPEAIERDTEVKGELAGDGIGVRSFPGQLLFAPWSVKTGQGTPYRVYSPYWRAVRGLDIGPPLPPVTGLIPPDHWPVSDRIEDWHLGDAMQRGAGVVVNHLAVGETAARGRLARFVEDRMDGYGTARDMLAKDGTSLLGENLAFGELSPRRAWCAGLAAQERGSPGAERFLKELAWREFAWHLFYHNPTISRSCWRPEWESFPWSSSEDAPDVQRWCRGRTGVDVIDAAMRELYVTGRMHNRARMIVASYLTKHLGVHWRIGLSWFADTLIDWDPASNAMGWQWVAGCGPDAAPYFRVFNPMTQAEKFDPEGEYRHRWLDPRKPGAQAFLDAAPVSWNSARPRPSVGPEQLASGRRAALASYERWKELRMP
ncbi:MAG: cryptochrome/photolyase family protein [Brevirhabdus sp.]